MNNAASKIILKHKTTNTPGEMQARDNSPPLANVDALIDYASL